MSRQIADVEVNSFVKGLITEAGPLTFPENASISEKNFVLNRDGSRQRRLGLDFEDSYVEKDTGQDLVANSSRAISTHIWENPNLDGSLEIAVVQVGNDLYFYDIGSEVLSEGILNSGNPVSPSFDKNVRINTANIQNRLIIARGTSSVAILEYDKDTDTISTDFIRLSVRDSFGIESSLDVDERPVFLENSHRYNLHNQGWPQTDYRDTNSVFRLPHVHFAFQEGEYPSNADIWYFGQEPDGGLYKFTSQGLFKQAFGATPAPKGHFTIDIFERSQSREEESGLSLPLDRTQGFISNVASYAGRVFYSVTESKPPDGDSNTPNIGSLVFYSKVVASKEDLGKCHSSQDPTAQDLNETVDSDGGFVSIPDAGVIYGLATLGNSLFVIANNGAWEIHGGETFFSATNQNVNRITKVGALSGSSILASEEILSYWAESGIQIISKDEVSLRGSSQNITYQTIQSLYEEIPTDSKLKATGVYDPVARQVRWMYGDSLANGYFANKELIFDLNLEAFYTSEISDLSSDSPYIAGYIPLPSTIYVQDSTNVVVGTEDVVIGSDSVITAERVIDESVKGSTKYLSLYKNDLDSNWSFTFSNYKQVDYKDWVNKDGVGLDAPASLLTGFLTAGVPSKDKKTPYLVTHFRRTEEGFADDGSGNLSFIEASSCFVQSQWEWTNSESSGRWGRKFQAYKLPRYYGPAGSGDSFDFGFSVVTTKNKLRGKGRALSLLFESEEGKNVHLYGWGHTLTIETKS